MPRYHRTGKVINQIGEYVDEAIANGYEPVGIVLNMVAFLRLKQETGQVQVGQRPFSLEFSGLVLPVFYSPPLYGKNSPITIIATKLIKFGNI